MRDCFRMYKLEWCFNYYITGPIASVKYFVLDILPKLAHNILYLYMVTYLTKKKLVLVKTGLVKQKSNTEEEGNDIFQTRQILI